jgi:hypothetical protein
VRLYVRILAVLYAFGGALHVADVFDLRLPFSRLPVFWKGWIVYLLIADALAAIGLWQRKRWGTGCFLVVAASQLLVYGTSRWGRRHEWPLLVFHIVTVTIWAALALRARRLRA